MATNTRDNQTDSRANIEPSYQYDPWDDTRGAYSSHLDNDRSAQADGRHDNGQGYEDRAATQQQSAIQKLRNAENKALSPKDPFLPGEGKDNGKSLYTGSGRPKEQEQGKKKGKGFLKGKGPLVAIIASLIGFGTFLGTSNSLLAPAISTLFTSKTQTNYSSYTLRSRYITRYMLQRSSGGAVTTGGFTGRIKYARIPTRLKNRLAKFNIEVDNTGGNTSMTWTHTTSTGGTEIISGIDAEGFVDLYNNNPAFREDYTNARYGRAATFYDKVADKIYQKLGISRNLQRNYTQTGNADVDAENYNRTLSAKFDGDDVDLSTKVGSITDDGVDENGNPKTKTKLYDSNTDASTNSSNTEVEARTKASGMITDIAGHVGMLGNALCTTLKIGSMIGVTAAAMERLQSINYALAQLESISKMKAGYGDESGINTLMNFLTTPVETKVQDYDPSALSSLFSASAFSNYNSDEYELPSTEGKEIPMTTEKGAPVEASGFQNLLSDTPVPTGSTQNYSLERILKSMGGAATFSIGVTTACAAVGLTTNIISLAVTLSPAGLVALAGNFISSLVGNIAVGVAASAFFAFLVPTLAKVFFRNVIDTALGIPAGQFMAQGIAASNMSTANAQAPSGKDAIQAFNRTNNEVLAMEAEQDRYRLSPFDTSNPNTFFGSIAYSLLPTITSTSTSSIASFLRSTSTSLASLMGRVSADGEGSSYITTFGDCPLLDEIGVMGDIYCNPIVTTDMRLINLSPEDTAYNNILTNENATNNNKKNLNCDNDGNCTINSDSNLAKYISYCDNRNSPFGVVDQNILNDLGFNTGTIADTLISGLPIIGDIVDTANNIKQMTTDDMLWANGSRCSNTEQNSQFWETEGKYYQVYINDQRILENMGAYDDSTNPVLAYEEAYEKEHPVDNSYLGYISRISGLNLENTETVLAVVAYYTYLNDYDPSVRLAIEDLMTNLSTEDIIANLKSERIIIESEDLVDNPLETSGITREYIIYNDIRNRSFAV